MSKWHKERITCPVKTAGAKSFLPRKKRYHLTLAPNDGKMITMFVFGTGRLQSAATKKAEDPFWYG
jgi:hypothetical protein